MKVIIKRVLNSFRFFYKLFIRRDPFTITVFRWFRDRGDSTLRLDYPLTENSIVFDVGGYMGVWSSQIIKKYDPYVFIFEPVPQFYSLIVAKFKENPKVAICNFGLLDRNGTAQISIADDGSSLYRQTDYVIDIHLRDIWDFLAEENIKRIDLMKINIEGAEYPLLKRMVDTRIVEKCYDIQVQFHSNYPRAEQLRNEIRDSLQKSHFITYDYPFVWENWRVLSPFPDQEC